jgi:2-methylisocitrate lyase-like PEP mutase family enzyme
MPTHAAHAATFHRLHVPGQPLVLFNAWDAGSARAIAKAGAAAIATGSWSVAAANGFPDGEKVPLELALANLARIVGATGLPVSVDLESGYGADAEGVGRTVALAIAAGAVGANIEDSFPADGKLRPVAEQATRLAAARSAAGAGGHDFFLNARTDVFFQKPADAHDGTMVAQAIERATAYAAAGADGLFVPGLVNEELIASVVRQSPLPVNVMVGGGSPSNARLAELGVARISHGPGPYLAMMAQLEQAARMAMGQG